MTTTPSTALVSVAPVFTNTERLALAGFLAGYSGLTRQAYELDLRQYASWCHQHHLRLFQARRADIECFARDLETRGPGHHHPATVHHRRVLPLRGGKKICWITHLPRTSAGPGWITTPTSARWTATSWVRCWSPPG